MAAGRLPIGGAVLPAALPDGESPTTVTASLTAAPAGPETDATVRDLVVGLDDVAAVPIPYGGLPGRASTAYRGRYAVWSDIAGETVSALRAVPGAGERTVQAILAAAREAVTAQRVAGDRLPMSAADAAADLLARLDDRDRAVLAELYWADDPASHEVVAHRCGVSIAWLSRHHRRVLARFTEMLAHPASRDVARHAAALASALGPYVPVDVVGAALRDLGVDPCDPAAPMLLYAAGPYRRHGDWYENVAIGGRSRCDEAVDRVFAASASPTADRLTAALGAAGMPSAAVPHYLSSLAVRRFGDVCVRWSRHNTDNVAAVLHALGTPSTAQDIHAAIGVGTLKWVQSWLSTSPTFIRASRTRWALAEWGLPEYGSIADEVGARIDAAGGRVATSALIADLVRDFPDVAEGSVRTILSTPAFVVELGVARRRTPDDPLPPVGPLNTARGALRDADGGVRIAITVTPLLLRGDGQSLPAAASAALGVNVGDHAEFRSTRGPVPVSWPATSSAGPYSGTLRALARHVGAAVGDTLALVFATATQTLEAARIGADVTGAELLRQLTGVPDLTVAMLAAALDCTPADVTKILLARGDRRWAAAVADLPE